MFSINSKNHLHYKIIFVGSLRYFLSASINCAATSSSITRPSADRVQFISVTAYVRRGREGEVGKEEKKTKRKR